MSKTSERRLAAARAWKKAHPDAAKRATEKRKVRYQTDPAYRESRLQWLRDHRKKRPELYRASDRARDPAKISARTIVRQRVYRGTIKRQPCEVCGEPNAQAHHIDYAKPLDIRWLCHAHHVAEHRTEARLEEK